MKLVEGGLYFDIYGETGAILQITSINEFEAHLEIVACNKPYHIGANGSSYLKDLQDLIPLTPLLEALL